MKTDLRFQTLVRVTADAVMVAVSLMIAFLLRFVWLVGVEHPDTPTNVIFYQFTVNYLTGLTSVVGVSLVLFFLNGFYTRGRGYSGRYKALVVAQAVSVAYLLVAFFRLLAPELVPIPRSVLPLAWLLTLLSLIGSRLWSKVWKLIAQYEQKHHPVDRNAPITTVLVIGGAGYIGSGLLAKLLKKGYRVRLLDLFMFGRETIRPLLDHPKLEIVEGDFRQIDTVVEAMQGMEAVIHLGGIVGDPACALDEGLTIEVNLMATRLIAEVAKGQKVRRFVFASTCSVYGANDQLLDECSELNPVSLYASSKIASERVLAQAASDTFAPVILRFGTIYGLSGRTRFDLVVNLLTAKAIVDGKITLFGGDQWRPFVHVDDAALAVLTALEAPAEVVENEVFNVGSDGQNYTLLQVGEIIKQLVPTAEVVDMGSGADRRNYRVSFAKIRKALNFQPQWTMEQGIKQVIEAIRSGKVEDYRDAKYSNVKFLTEEKSPSLVRTVGWEKEMIKQSALAEK